MSSGKGLGVSRVLHGEDEPVEFRGNSFQNASKSRQLQKASTQQIDSSHQMQSIESDNLPDKIHDSDQIYPSQIEPPSPQKRDISLNKRELSPSKIRSLAEQRNIHKTMQQEEKKRNEDLNLPRFTHGLEQKLDQIVK